MYMTVSKISRKDASPCAAADHEVILPSMPSYDSYQQEVADLQAAGKIIYRSGSLNEAGELETVTLYLTQEDYTAFRNNPVWAPFESALGEIYNPVVVTEETI